MSDQHTEAFINGWIANKNGVSDLANPYDWTVQGYSAREWVRGWEARARTKNMFGDLYLDEYAK